MKFDITGKIVVLTGGTSGIGRVLVDLLAERTKLIVIGRDAAKLKALEHEYSSVTTVHADMASKESVTAAAKQLSQTGGPIDVLINNAAMQYEPYFTSSEFDPKMIGREMDVNFTNICYLIHGLLPAMNRQSASVILNIGSGLGLAAKPASAIYCASKGALNIFSQSLRYQLEEQNIHVLQALLPMVQTPMTEGRGSGKITAEDAAAKILQGLINLKPDNDIGKVKLLRRMLRLAPSVAYKIMQKAG